MTTNFLEEFEKKTAYAEDVIRKFLPEEKGFQETVLKAMNYSVKAGGKRLRPLLIDSTFRLFHGKGNACENFMAAMEFIHTYSLIHDDLPAMDNDDLRRGKPTCHKVFGEDMAILAGDALLNYAYETVAGAFTEAPDETQAIALAFQVLSKKAGIYGMVGGQTVDVENDGKPIDAEQLHMIYENKTGALLEASMMCGAVLAHVSPDDLNKIEEIASDIGIAFQIQDDILDVIGDSTVLGKPIGSDDKNQKITYVTLYGLEAASEKVAELTGHANMLLDSLSAADADTLCFMKELFDWLVNRKN